MSSKAPCVASILGQHKTHQQPFLTVDHRLCIGWRHEQNKEICSTIPSNTCWWCGGSEAYLFHTQMKKVFQWGSWGGPNKFTTTTCVLSRVFIYLFGAGIFCAFPPSTLSAHSTDPTDSSCGKHSCKMAQLSAPSRTAARYSEFQRV